jgi:hypothetical protein
MAGQRARQTTKPILKAASGHPDRQAGEAFERIPNSANSAPSRIAGQQLTERWPLRQAQDFSLTQRSFELHRRNHSGEVEERAGDRGHRNPIPERHLIVREARAMSTKRTA